MITILSLRPLRGWEDTFSFTTMRGSIRRWDIGHPISSTWRGELKDELANDADM